MIEQMGRALQEWWLMLHNPVVAAWGCVGVVFGFVGVMTVLNRSFLLAKAKRIYGYPAHLYYKMWEKHLARRIRREQEMKRARLLALKKDAAVALLNWLMYEVSLNRMSLDESYELQRTLAHNISYPDLMPLHDPEYIKKQIRERRKRGEHRPVRLPDSSRRATLKLLLNGEK